MKKMISLLLPLICIASMPATAQTLRGKVTDAISGEALIGATVKVVELENKAAVTDVDDDLD